MTLYRAAGVYMNASMKSRGVFRRYQPFLKWLFCAVQRVQFIGYFSKAQLWAACYGDAENARHEIAEQEKSAPYCKDGKCGTWKCGKRFSDQRSITGAPKRYGALLWVPRSNNMPIIATVSVLTPAGCPDDGDDSSDSDDDDATVPDTNSQTESQVDTAPDTPPETDTDNCEVCLLAPRNPRIALVPCGHQRFCSACAEPTVCVTKDAVVLYAVRISLSSWICTEKLYNYQTELNVESCKFAYVVYLRTHSFYCPVLLYAGNNIYWTLNDTLLL